LFTNHTRYLENFSVVSSVTIQTPGRGAAAVTKDHKQISCLTGSVRPNKFLDAAFHRFDGGNKQKEVRVRTSTVKRGVFLGSRLLKAASKNLFGRALQTTMPYMLLDM
jgi:hypothetical protein